MRFLDKPYTIFLCAKARKALDWLRQHNRQQLYTDITTKYLPKLAKDKEPGTNDKILKDEVCIGCIKSEIDTQDKIFPVYRFIHNKRTLKVIDLYRPAKQE